MKKTAIIALAAALLVAAIVVIGSAGTTGASGPAAAWGLETPYEAPMQEKAAMAEIAAEESAKAEFSADINADSDKAQLKAAESEPLLADAQTPAPMNAVPASSPTPIAAAQAAPAIAPAVETPATAAQTTTTTRYVPPQTTAATTTQPLASTTILYTKGNYEWVGTPQAATTTTTQYVPPATTTRPTTTTTTTTRATTTITTTSTTTTTAAQAGTDFASNGQAVYQDEAIRALNALRAERGLPPMTVNATLMANSLAHAQKMAAAGKEYHSTENLPGCESVCYVPANFPAKLLGETLGKHTPQFLESSRSSVGIAVVLYGGRLYAVMQGN